jgi:hypothetical protein
MAVKNMTRTNPESAGKSATFADRVATTDTSDIYLIPESKVEDIGGKVVTASGVTATIAQTQAGVEGVKEVRTITVTAACSADGNAIITLNGVRFDVALTTASDTTGKVATVLRAATYSGWVVTGTGNDVVFTAAANGARAGTYAFVGGATGAAASFAQTTAGVTAVAEVQSVTITAACNANSYVHVTLNSVMFSVPVTTALDTAAKVATALRAATYAGWTVSGTDADVTFTAAVAEARAGTYAISGGATGVTASFVQTTAGANAVAEVREMTVTAACNSNGNITITLNGAAFVVAVTTALDSAAKVATLLRATTFAGWTTSGEAEDVVFTASTGGVRGGAYTFDGAATGVTATGGITRTTEGLAAVAEVQTLTVTNQCTTAGIVRVTINGTAVEVAVTAAMDTVELVATAIRAVAVTGWTITGADDAIIYTADAAGLVEGAFTFFAGASGVTATGGMVRVTQGVTAVKEVETLTVSAACSLNGNVYVTLNSVRFTVPVTTAMNTTGLVATALRAATYAGWVVTGANNDVIFTAVTAEARGGTYSFVGGATGVTATGGVVQTTEGITAVPEIQTVTVTAAATADGVIDIKLDDVEFAVEVAAGDTINQVAAKIRASTFAGWVLSGATTDAICTATVAEARAGAYSVTVTGTAALQFSFSPKALLEAGRGVFTAWDNSAAINPAVTAWRVVASAGGAAGEVSVKTTF